MTVVPGLALFSHHVPSSWRQEVRGRLAALVRRAFPPSEAKRAVEPAAPVAAPLVALPPLAEAPAASVAHEFADGQPWRDRLGALGATAVECRPVPDTAGVHVASCRVALDAGGQLQRVFQATATDPVRALAALHDEVSAWKRRAAPRRPSDGGS